MLGQFHSAGITMKRASLLRSNVAEFLLTLQSGLKEKAKEHTEKGRQIATCERRREWYKKKKYKHSKGKGLVDKPK